MTCSCKETSLSWGEVHMWSTMAKAILVAYDSLHSSLSKELCKDLQWVMTWCRTSRENCVYKLVFEKCSSPYWQSEYRNIWIQMYNLAYSLVSKWAQSCSYPYICGSMHLNLYPSSTRSSTRSKPWSSFPNWAVSGLLIQQNDWVCIVSVVPACAATFGKNPETTIFIDIYWRGKTHHTGEVIRCHLYGGKS